HGDADLPAAADPAIDARVLDAVADELWRARGDSLIVCGANDVDTQILVLAANELLGNVGATIDADNLSNQKCGDDASLAQLVDDMERGRIEVLILYGANPVYDAADGERFRAAMARVPLTISFADRLDETATHAAIVCPDHHFLEAWGDAEPIASSYSLAQPAIAPLFDTRAAQESLLTWLGRPEDFYVSVRAFWRTTLFPRQTRYATFDEFWDHSLHDGVYAAAPRERSRTRFAADWKGSFASVARAQAGASHGDRDRFELHLYEPVGVRDGAHANNPWLQELPDPVSKVTWGNYAAIAPADATRLAVASGDVVALDAGGHRIELPVHVQPGQAPRTISVALGYGRTRAGHVGDGVGVNVFALTPVVAGTRRYARDGITVARTGRREALATTQSHHSMEGRAIVKELRLTDIDRGHGDGETADLPTLWAARPRGGHNWGMAIDLSACTGCSACVTACQAENNV